MNIFFLNKLFLSHYTHLTRLDTCRAEDNCIPAHTLRSIPWGKEQKARPGFGAVNQ